MRGERVNQSLRTVIVLEDEAAEHMTCIGAHTRIPGGA